MTTSAVAPVAARHSWVGGGLAYAAMLAAAVGAFPTHQPDGGRVGRRGRGNCRRDGGRPKRGVGRPCRMSWSR